MKFSIIASFALLGSVIASPVSIEKRDDRKIREAITRVTGSINSVATHLARKPTAPDQQQGYVDRALELNQLLIDTLAYGNGFVRDGPTLNTLELTGLVGTLFTMYGSVNSLVSNWVSAKPYVYNVNRQNDVLRQLRDLQNNGFGFTDAILSKTGGGFNRGVTDFLTSGLASSITTAINDYQKPPRGAWGAPAPAPPQQAPQQPWGWN